MRFAILSRNPRTYSTRRMLEAGARAGHSMEVIDPLRCYMLLATQNAKVFYRGLNLNRIDAVIPRIGFSTAFYGTAVIRQFEMAGVYVLNESVAVSRTHDKLRSLQILSKHGIGIPTSGFASSTTNSTELIRLVGGPPLVIRMVHGSGSDQVVMADTENAALAVMESFRELSADFLVQEYVRESIGNEIRCLVMGNKVIGASNRPFTTSKGRGKVIAIKMAAEERKVVTEAVKILKLDFAGVDFLRSNRGPLILDVHSSPSLRDIEIATGNDVATQVIAYMLKKHKAHHAQEGLGP